MNLLKRPPCGSTIPQQPTCSNASLGQVQVAFTFEHCSRPAHCEYLGFLIFELCALFSVADVGRIFMLGNNPFPIGPANLLE
jgi:hypothetical protein